MKPSLGVSRVGFDESLMRLCLRRGDDTLEIPWDENLGVSKADFDESLMRLCLRRGDDTLEIP